MAVTQTVRKVLKFVELPEGEGPSSTTQWINDDLRPVPLERRTWGWLQYFELWFLVNVNISSYQVGSSLLTIGLTWWQAIIVIVAGNLLASGFAILNSIAGVSSHLGYSVISRSVWGIYGAYFPILNRIMVSVVWYGIQAVIGGKMVYVCIRAIWPSFEDIPNTFPESMGITVAQFVGYIIFNLFCCIMIWFKPHKMQLYFHVGAALTFIAFTCLLGWALGTRPKGEKIGDAFQGEPLQGSTLAWTFLSGMMAQIGAIASAILNQSDYTRFAKRRRQVTSSQFISYNVSVWYTSIVGILVTAATQTKYGEGTAIWDPSDLLVKIQDGGSSGARAATFFLGLAFVISQISINVPGNVFAAGLDVASLFPKYIDLRRGAYVLAALSVAPVPWKQLASGSIFLTVLSAYAVFLGPMVGLLCCHYWIIQKRKFHIPDIYEGSSKSVYWYFKGFNWRTFVAWIVGIAPSLPGFLNSVNPNISVSDGAKNFYSLTFILGFLISGFVAWALDKISPADMSKTTELELEIIEGSGDDLHGLHDGSIASGPTPDVELAKASSIQRRPIKNHEIEP